jgi:Trehalose-phosphatase
MILELNRCLPALAQQINATTHLFVGLDYDGTLTPIVNNPAEASLSPAVREVLAKLAQLSNTTVAIVTGRALADVRERVNLGSLAYAGNHGLEIHVGDNTFLPRRCSLLFYRRSYSNCRCASHPTLAFSSRKKASHLACIFETLIRLCTMTFCVRFIELWRVESRHSAFRPARWCGKSHRASAGIRGEPWNGSERCAKPSRHSPFTSAMTKRTKTLFALSPTSSV